MNHQGSYWDRLASLPLDASVIDPNDRLGFKNRYITEIRNGEIMRVLSRNDHKGVALDLGCGTGSLSSVLAIGGWKVIGLDISHGLLSRTPERGLHTQALFVQYNGTSIPLRDASVDVITTYVVLNHILDDHDLVALLSECRRVLKPGCCMVCIEQVRKRPHLDRVEWKHQRTPDSFMSAFVSAGLRVRSQAIVRYGHFPTTVLIRLGLIPPQLFRWLAGVERAYGRLRGIAPRDYSDVVFELEKPRGDV
jgi:ubiquinone/menaquinone biosynthesis C-methylase UbiE